MFQMDITRVFVRRCVMVRYGYNNQKFHYPIKVRVGSNNFPKIKFKVCLTWRPVLMISVTLQEW